MTTHSPELDQLAAALSAVQAEVGSIPKTADNPFFKSKFADLPAVVATASPIVTKHGLSVSQFPGFDEHGDTLTTWLLHKSGQFISQPMRLHSAPGKGQSAVQGLGSAMTYTRRYAYMSILGLVADVDDDGQAAGAAHSSQQRAGNGNGHAALATAADVEEMRTAAKDLEADQVKLALAACGIEGVTAYNKVPATKVAQLVKALSGIERA